MPWVISSPWKPKIKEKLVELWPHGWSCSALAEKINTEFNTRFSRNAIIGKANRLGLEPRRENYVWKSTNSKKPRTTRAKAWKPPSQLFTEIETTPIIDFAPLNIGFIDLQENQCREVMGKGPDGLAIYCGHQKLESCSYCVTHAKINYHTPQPERRTLGRPFHEARRA